MVIDELNKHEGDGTHRNIKQRGVDREFGERCNPSGEQPPKFKQRSTAGDRYPGEVRITDATEPDGKMNAPDARSAPGNWPTTARRYGSKTAESAVVGQVIFSFPRAELD